MSISSCSLLIALSIGLVICEIDVPVTENWFGGFRAGKCVPIVKELLNWRAHLRFSEDVHSIEIVVAIATKINSREYLLQNEQFNSHIQAGDQFCFQFTGHVTGLTIPRVTFSFEEANSPGTTTAIHSPNTITTTRTTHPPTTTTTTRTTHAPTTTTTTRTTHAPTTTTTARTTHPPTTITAIHSPTTITTTRTTLPPTTTTTTRTTHAPTTTTTARTTHPPTTTTTTRTTHAPTTTSVPTTANKDYRDALAKSILFYQAQRSGKLPANNPINWRGDSALNDCVPGGWYDAGDHVKFGLPMASSTTLLLWSLHTFRDGYVAAKELDNMYDMIKWPLDYFLKAWDPTNRRLTVQVGDGNADHSFWGRPEDMTMSRPCQAINSSSHGSDVAAETAASLALGSITFREKGDSSYAAHLLSVAENLYAFAKSNRGLFTGASPFYVSTGDKDELCLASIWLFRATSNPQYLNDAKNFSESTYSWALGWDDKKAACQVLLFEETRSGSYRDSVSSYFYNWHPGGEVPYTPCGLAWRDQRGPTRYAANSAFLALVAAQAGISTDSYRKWAVEQINYILGDNKHNGGCFSFEIGHGKQYPQQPHHRAASCPNRPAPCGQAQLNVNAPSPHILNGALVGGPDVRDNYKDVRTDDIQNEVATDYNSGFQGALAAINHLVATNSLPHTTNKCPCNS